MKFPTHPSLDNLIAKIVELEGFPEGIHKDIVQLSEAPWYTACPNPYLDDFIVEYGKPYDPESDQYEREPFTADIEEGKTSGLFNVHIYHTKIPPHAITKFIEHYTDPGDVVLDGFCGTGMTGLAAQLVGRKAILWDLSPIATFIAANYNLPAPLAQFQARAAQILKACQEELGWFYETTLDEGGNPARLSRINYTVWVDILVCGGCGENFRAYQPEITPAGLLKKQAQCPACGTPVPRTADRVSESIWDRVLQKEVTRSRQEPILINCVPRVESNADSPEWGKAVMKKPALGDMELIEKVNASEIPYWVPTVALPDGYNLDQPKRSHGYDHVHQFYTHRNLWSAAFLYDQITREPDPRLRNLLRFWFTSLCLGQSRLNRFFESSYSQVNRLLKKTLYIARKTTEVNPQYSFPGKIDRITRQLDFPRHPVIIGTGSATSFPLGDNAVDYIFTDPPYGDNIMYNEVNLLWEAWLKVRTATAHDAIVNPKQEGKSLANYGTLMAAAFREFFRVLKPKRWMTVVFHHSKSAVWDVVHEAIRATGFQVANVTMLDKKQDTFKQMTAKGSVKFELVINAQKPSLTETTTAQDASTLIVPPKEFPFEVVSKQLQILPDKPVLGRSKRMLYSRYLAQCVERGYAIQMDARDFYQWLGEHFQERDGCWF